jgi:hypothetical protein
MGPVERRVMRSANDAAEAEAVRECWLELSQQARANARQMVERGTQNRCRRDRLTRGDGSLCALTWFSVHRDNGCQSDGVLSSSTLATDCI